jgi:hypothetical protein
MRWIMSAGGPLILIPRSIIGQWRGVADGGEDYQAACAVTDRAGVIWRHGVDILVLNDEPLQTACVVSDRRPMLIRWMYAPSESAALAALHDFQDRRLRPSEAVLMTCKESRYVLLDAGADGSKLTEHLDVEIVEGVFLVETYVWKPNDEVGLVVHVFSKRESAHVDAGG